MEEALAVQVAQATGNIQGQLDADGPGQGGGAVQQLLQVPTVDVLQESPGSGGEDKRAKSVPFSPAPAMQCCIPLRQDTLLTSVKAWSWP